MTPVLITLSGLSKPVTEISDPARLSALIESHKTVRIL